MKIAVPTDATAGTTIATQPTTIASTPTVIRAFQLRASPARTSGSIETPLISMQATLSAHPDAIKSSWPAGFARLTLGSKLAIRGGVIGQHVWFWSRKRGFESFPRNLQGPGTASGVRFPSHLWITNTGRLKLARAFAGSG